MKEVTFNKVCGKKVIFSWVVVRYKVKKLKAEEKSSSGVTFPFFAYLLKKKFNLTRSNYLKAEVFVTKAII